MTFTNFRGKIDLKNDLLLFIDKVIETASVRNEEVLVNLNKEGAESFQSRDPRSLAIHASNYTAVLKAIQFFIDKETVKILEIGAGSGLYSQTLFEILENLSVDVELTCMDYNKNLVLYGDDQFPEINFVQGDALELDEGLLKNLDVVFFCELWEHIPEEDALRMIQELHDALPEGALVLFTTPDITELGGKETNYYPHEKEYTFEELKSILESGENPFEGSEVFRIVNNELSREVVKLTKLFGRYFNYFYGFYRRMILKLSLFEKSHEVLSSYIYKFLPYLRPENFFEEAKEKYSRTYMINKDDEGKSFSLLAVLRK